MFNRSTISKVSVIAEKRNIEPAALLAVAEVESGGKPIWNVRGKSMPAMRFEGHYFYRLLKGNKAKLAQAVKAGLANPKAGGVKNPASYEARYALLERAKKIDVAAALASCSWGLGQVMGSHWKKLGYPSVQALVAEASSGVDGQIEVMARYIDKFGLVDELQTLGFASFAAQYNGPNYRVNDYDGKMKRAYARYIKLLGVPSDAPKSELDAVENELVGSATAKIQKDLKRLGYLKGPVDGKYGLQTKAAVKAFQKANGLVADGKYGPMTDEAVDAEIARLDQELADRLTAGGGAGTGISGATEVVREQLSGWEQLAYYMDSPVIKGIIIVLMLSMMAMGAYGVYLKFFKKKGVQ
jgi:hypothetical protein